MTDKTFWSILGGILVGWLALFFLLIVSGSMSKYAETAKELENTIGKMERFAKNSPEKLPTSKLLQVREQELESQRKVVENAERFYAEREERLTAGVPTPEATWINQYRDQYNDLRTAYGALAHPEVRDSDGEIVFEVQEFTQEDLDGDEYKLAARSWLAEKWMIEQVIAAEGLIDSMEAKVSLKEGRQKEGEAHQYFSRQAVTAVIQLPPTAVGPFLAGLLSQDDLMLEVHDLQVVKDPARLVHEIVVAEDARPAREPLVVVELAVDVLHYHPRKNETDEDAGE